MGTWMFRGTYSTEQCFSNFNVCRKHLELLLKMHILVQQVWGGALSDADAAAPWTML